MSVGGIQAVAMENEVVMRNRQPAEEFQIPVRYPRYTKADYESMPEWKLNRLLSDYGLPVTGTLADKRAFAVGNFLWR